MSETSKHRQQPLLHDELVALSAPTQVWSSPDGSMGSRPLHGVYHSDTRIVGALTLLVDGQVPEIISHSVTDAATLRFVSLLRHLDGRGADPRVLLNRVRQVRDGRVTETIELTSAITDPIETTVTLELTPSFDIIHDVKGGVRTPDVEIASLLDDAGVHYSSGGVTASFTSADADLVVDANGLTTASWSVTIPAHGSVSVSWELAIVDPSAVVRGASGASEWAGVTARADDSRLGAWVDTALKDLAGLRMVTRDQPDEVFLAAGAPWFFTLFGRDSIWAARMLLPLGTGLAASTLRVLAALQGTETVAATAEQPGKIMHELRPGTLDMPGEETSLPPLYYGTVDATALWITLLHDAWKWGMADAEVEALLPNLETALVWMRSYGDSDGDGFLEYVDSTGHGLANQGWKDSGDSIQWRDGRLSEGPIALCEVQAYAYQAAIGGAELLDHFGRSGGADWRDWAAALKVRFNEAFWIESPDGAYPAVALDAHKQKVDTVTSNIGHLLGTGILDEKGSRLVAQRLISPELSSGYGLRTMSTDSTGYWPLSYHGGSVWTHDTAIAIAGLGRAGFGAEAAILIEGLLRTAEGFDYRMPELHSGHSTEESAAPIPYPAACRPQAWSAASAVAVLGTILGLEPDAQAGELGVSPLPIAGGLDVRGLVFGGRSFELATDASGAVSRNTLLGAASVAVGGA
ncbi:glycogen debranching N-terminal domain-containing protein [Cryobacterium fucosi]|uniref:Amylo-alpha-1,6-glucosidase n=1 Tax=Cryobacterium fucosi TaxID=1259157 RepID=A0A4R9BH40_9MICO|nr:glycogen debranching N-terminal domain-containing protein [Cryobacterium fucosi]TFD82574.1 amylo-alpha-1,6-glucosidase [Cryobacterium fucosi]